MLTHYLKIAFCNLWKYKTQSVINILGLSVGFAAFFFAVYWHQWEHSFDTFHPEWEKTYAITTTGLFKTSTDEEGEINQLHKSDAEVLTSFPEVSKVSKIRDYWGLIKTKDNREVRITGYKVDSTFFSLFQANFIEGNIHKIPFNEEYVVLAHKMALRLFGTTQCVGEVISISEDVQYKVSGVMADYPGNTEFMFNMLVLTSGDNLNNNMGRSTYFIQVHRKNDAIALKEKIESHKSIAVDPYSIVQPQRWQFHLRSLPEVHFTCNHSLAERFRNIDILYWSGLLLLICVLMNNLVLFIGQQQYKLKNNITYFSMGAEYVSIVCKYVVLLLIPVFIALLLSLVIIESIFPKFDNFTTIRDIVTAVVKNSMNSKDLLFQGMINTSICIILYLLISLIPIFYLVNSSKTKSKNYSFAFFRRLLIVGQIFIGSLFFITSLCLYKQLHFIKNKPKGINIENVLQVYLGYETSSRTDMEAVKDKLMQIPEVEDVTLMVDPLLLPDGMFNNLGILAVDGRDREKMREDMEWDNFLYVQDNFFRFFNIIFKEGTPFNKEENRQYVVNEAGAKNIGFNDLLQRTTDGGTGSVTGIIQDYHYSPLRYPVKTVVFSLLDKRFDHYKYIYIKVTPDHIGPIKDIIDEFDRGEVIGEQKYVWLTDMEKDFNRPEETIFLIFSVFALLCILISSFGIYSLVALTTEQRVKEIAIRKINGAMFRDILTLFLKEYFILVIIGNLIALPLGYAFIKRWLETYSYHTTIGFALLLLVFLITCGIVIISVARQVVQASKTNPAEAVKSE